MVSINSHAEGFHNHGHDHGTKESIGESGKSSDATRTIEIKMFDNYAPEEISVNFGETVRFVIQNSGEFVHEFNIATAKKHATLQKEMMLMMVHGTLEVDKINHAMMEMDTGDGRTMEHNDPNSVLQEPGMSGEVTWKFTRAGGLEFACNVPGHYDSDMLGQVRFK